MWPRWRGYRWGRWCRVFRGRGACYAQQSRRPRVGRTSRQSAWSKRHPQVPRSPGVETRSNSSLAEKLRDGALYERAPQSLRAQVQARLNAEADKQAKEAKQAQQKPSFWNGSWRMTGLLFIGGG